MELQVCHRTYWSSVMRNQSTFIALGHFYTCANIIILYYSLESLRTGTALYKTICSWSTCILQFPSCMIFASSYEAWIYCTCRELIDTRPFLTESAPSNFLVYASAVQTDLICTNGALLLLNQETKTIRNVLTGTCFCLCYQKIAKFRNS